MLSYNQIMTTLTFDTLKFANKLKSAGVPAPQAEAEAMAIAEAFEASEVATKSDIALVRSDLGHLEARFNGKFALLQWMIAFNLAFTMAMLWKVFS